MDKKVTVSLFYGGGLPQGSIGEGDSSCPFQGDPLDDILASMAAEVKDRGYSEEEVKERIKRGPRQARIVITKDTITLDGYSLGRLNPSVRAFYILVCSHPEGLEVGEFHDKYLDEYQDIFYELERVRGEKEGKGMTFELDKRAPRYRDDIRKAIEKIELDHPELDLSSCKIYGKTKWRIGTKKVSIRMGTNSLKEL